MLRRDSESAKTNPCRLCGCGGESEVVQKDSLIQWTGIKFVEISVHER
jgi:hypothetical protein